MCVEICIYEQDAHQVFTKSYLCMCVCVCVCVYMWVCVCMCIEICRYEYAHQVCTTSNVRVGTANPTWGDIFESSKLKARTSLLPRFDEKRRSSVEL